VRDGVVTLRVGSPGATQDLFVHKTLLCQYSPFFESALKQDWKESKDNVIELPEDDVMIVDLYIAWLYGKNPFAHPHPCQCKDGPANIFKQLSVGAWKFGDKVLDHLFCDLVIDMALLYGERGGNFSVNLFFASFHASALNDPVHNLLGDSFVYLAPSYWLKGREGSAEAYKEIAERMLKEGNRYGPDEAPWFTDPCLYHWHKKHGGACYKDKVDWGKDIVVSA